MSPVVGVGVSVGTGEGHLGGQGGAKRAWEHGSESGLP